MSIMGCKDARELQWGCMGRVPIQVTKISDTNELTCLSPDIVVNGSFCSLTFPKMSYLRSDKKV